MVVIQIMCIEIGVCFNIIVVVVKVIGVVVVVGVGVFYINIVNWYLFILLLVYDVIVIGGICYGMDGVLVVVSIVFFVVFGYDMLIMVVEELKNLQCDLLLVVIFLLVVVIGMYLVILFVFIGMVLYNGCIDLIEIVGQCMQMILVSDVLVSVVFVVCYLNWVSGIIDIVVVCGIVSVVFVFMLGVVCIWFVLVCDGLLLKWFVKSYFKYGMLYCLMLLLGVFIVVVVGFLLICELVELVNIGMLLVFIVICVLVLILWVKQLYLECCFCMLVLWLLVLLGIVFLLFLIIGWLWVIDGKFYMIGGLDMVIVWCFVIWMVLGLVIYFVYGICYSMLVKL